MVLLLILYAHLLKTTMPFVILIILFVDGGNPRHFHLPSHVSQDYIFYSSSMCVLVPYLDKLFRAEHAKLFFLRVKIPPEFQLIALEILQYSLVLLIYTFNLPR
uniref:Uncharacterized protein n=1 Tax=Arundo donax TaxID=35708 RepID=A0A0A9DI32_ARUDO